MGQALKLAVAMLAMGWGAPALSAQQAQAIRPVDVEINKLDWEWDRLVKARQYDAAIAVMLKALQLAEGADGANAERAGHFHTRLGSLYLSKGDKVSAEAAYRRAFSIFDLKYGQRLPGWSCYIPALLAQLSRLEAQIPYYERAIACYEATPKPGSPSAIDAVIELAHFYRYWPERTQLVAKAGPLIDRWIPIAVRDLGPDHHEVAELWRGRADAYQAMGDKAGARAARLRALDILSRGPGPAKGDKAKLKIEQNVLVSLKGMYRPDDIDETYVGYQARYVAVVEQIENPASGITASARAHLASLREQFPNWRPPSEAARAPAPVRQAAVAPAPVPAGGGGDRVEHAPPPGAGVKPVWPTGMETGNLYFVVSGNTDGTYKSEDAVPIMVAAESAAEAVERVRRAHLQSLRGGYEGRAVHARVIEAGECKGPVWGAVAANSVEEKKGFAWGGGCGKTPAQAIEAAFAACRKKGPVNCDTVGTTYRERRQVILALSGRSSWSGYYCVTGCTPSPPNNFGSYNAFSEGSYALSEIEGEADAIAKLGKACAGQPCYLTTTTVRCFDESAPDVRTAKCTDARLTPRGYSGPIR